MKLIKMSVTKDLGGPVLLLKLRLEQGEDSGIQADVMARNVEAAFREFTAMKVQDGHEKE